MLQHLFDTIQRRSLQIQVNPFLVAWINKYLYTTSFFSVTCCVQGCKFCWQNLQKELIKNSVRLSCKSHLVSAPYLRLQPGIELFLKVPHAGFSWLLHMDHCPVNPSVEGLGGGLRGVFCMHYTCLPVHFSLSDNSFVDENQYTHVPLNAIKSEGECSSLWVWAAQSCPDYIWRNPILRYLQVELVGPGCAVWACPRHPQLYTDRPDSH